MDPSKQTADEQYVLAGEVPVAVTAPNGGMKRGHKCTLLLYYKVVLFVGEWCTALTRCSLLAC